MKKTITTFLKIAFVGLLLVFLAKKGFLSVEAMQRALSRPDKWVPAVVILFFTTALTFIRWQWLLRAQGVDLKWVQVFQLGMIGNFFNIALPGAVSGDLVKAFYIAKEAPARRGHVFGSILFDRLAGLSALVMVSSGTLLIHFGEYVSTPLFAAIKVFLMIALVCVVVFYGYLFLMPQKNDPILRLLKSLEKRQPRIGSVTRIYEGVKVFQDHRAVVLKVAIVSVFIFLGVCSSVYLLTESLSDNLVHSGYVFVVAPIGLLVTAVPIAPAGVGTGHAAFGVLFKLFGFDRGADVFSLYALVQLVMGGLGGLVYLRYKGSHGGATPNLS